ncbi:hypothetical protein Q5752_002153 [Cryptotrichosporon argae]
MSRPALWSTATALSVTVYAAHRLNTASLLNDDTPILSAKKPRAPVFADSPYVPLAWGSNRYLTLFPDSTAQVKRPTPMTHLSATPLRDLTIAEKYGAAVDAQGNLWMWGTGYDSSGAIGRSLRGKKLASLAPGPSKLYGISKDGRIYAVSADRAFQTQIKHARSWWSFFSTDPGVDYVELAASLHYGERWAGIAAGRHHLLAVTNRGRTFSLPLSTAANTHRQLGTREVFTSSVTETEPERPSTSGLPAESDIRFATTLTEVPALAGIAIAQVAASERTSFVRTAGGRVLGFGANDYGQIGLGAAATVDTVPTPVEVVLARAYPGGTTVRCTNVAAGGTTTLFTVERTPPGRADTFIDLLACGNGISGALGNGLWSSAAGSPTRVKTVSGLQEYSEKAKAFLPLPVHAVSISPAPLGHVFAVLDTVSHADQDGVKRGIYGKDVMVWGGNADYQLGNGKRSSLAVPQHLPPLVSRLGVASSKEASLSSGTPSPMPHSRLQLHQTRTDAYDLDGKLLKRNVRVEECMVAGYNASVLYNKIID